MTSKQLRAEALALLEACQNLNDVYQLDNQSLLQFDADFAELYNAAKAARQGMVTEDTFLLLDNVSKLHNKAGQALQYLACYAYNRINCLPSEM
jgi:hypothetical protein